MWHSFLLIFKQKKKTNFLCACLKYSFYFSFGWSLKKQTEKDLTRLIHWQNYPHWLHDLPGEFSTYCGLRTGYILPTLEILKKKISFEKLLGKTWKRMLDNSDTLTQKFYMLQNESQFTERYFQLNSKTKQNSPLGILTSHLWNHNAWIKG